MSIAVDILKADNIDVRELKEHLSSKLLKKILVIMDRGKPVSVNLPYPDLLKLLDIYEELNDAETLAAVEEGRRAIAEVVKGIPVSNLFDEIKQKTSKG